MQRYQRRTAQQWQSLVSDQLSSDLSAPQFCEQHQISYASFSKWRKRLAEPSLTQSESPPPVFVELSTVEQTPSQQWAAELELGTGMVLRIAKA